MNPASSEPSPTVAPMTAANPTVYAAAPRHHSRRLMVVVILALILVVGGTVGAVLLQKYAKKSTNQAKTNSDLAKQNAENNSGGTTSSANLPAGYQKVSRDCFSLGLPDQDITLATDNSCFLQASYSTGDGQGSINIFPETNTYDSLQAFVDAKKQQYSSVVISEKDLKIGGIAAHTVVENDGTADAPQSLARTYVLVSGKHYSYQSVPVTGFEINGSYNAKSWVFIYDTALSTWQWK